jgi:hypothetical protein
MELNDLLEELSKFSYKSAGFPMFCLYYQPAFNYWSCYYRTPKYFQNPQIEASSPLEACKQMKEFLKGLNNGTTQTAR